MEVRGPPPESRCSPGVQQRSLAQHTSLRMSPLLILTLALRTSLPRISLFLQPHHVAFVELTQKLGAQPSGSIGYYSLSIINPPIFSAVLRI